MNLQQATAMRQIWKNSTCALQRSSSFLFAFSCSIHKRAMSVVVIGRQEALSNPFPAEDYLTRRDSVGPLGQENGVLQMAHNVNAERGPEKPSGSDSFCQISNFRRSQFAGSGQSFGLLKYGCAHYRRRCRILAPCCGEVFDCRHCHNEAKNANEGNPSKRHDLPRHAVKLVICSICSTEQEVQQLCKNCGVCMGEYFCGKCKFFDDETKKGQYHCDACGICRIGGRDNFFHCQRCGCCYSTVLQKGHPCVENSMHHNCPVCFEYLFDSMKDITVMPCGHTMHLECLNEMRRHSQFSCPVCSKSTCDMSTYWEHLDQEVAATPMPEAYQNKMVWILCNDCGVTGKVLFHIIAHKCAKCNSYNTRQTRGGPNHEHVGPSSNRIL